jgi:hypothetical protein
MVKARLCGDNCGERLSYHSVTIPRHRRLLGAIAIGALFTLPAAARVPASSSSIIALVVSRSDPPARQYRALRRLEARSAKLGAAAWMEAWTEVDPQEGFHYRIIGEGGSGYIRSHVLKPWLENERKMWAAGDPERAGLSLANYTFEDRGITDDGLAHIEVKSRRKDLLLVDGSIFVNPDDGDLVRIEGRLSKTPSFWTRRVEVVRHYQRINGVRMPVGIESVAQVLIAGRSTFSMSYEYETVNNIRVGDPKPRTAGER